MDKRDVIQFFDGLAPGWDVGLIHDDRKIRAILDDADIGAGMRVLDVACGTGVLFPDYLERGVQSVTGVDISPAMIACARAKFDDPRITLIAGDIEETTFPEPFDRCVVYNAFPHFPDPVSLIHTLAEALRVNGRLTIAHGMSRAAIDRHHDGTASKVSMGLMPAAELAALMARRFTVDVIVSDDEKYAVSGVRIG